MNVVQIGGKTFAGPASWDEITPRQFRQLLNWRVRLDNDPAGRWALLHLWYGIRYRLTRLLTDEQRVDLLALLDFLDERPERWLLPRLRVKTRTYVGPGDGLEYLTFGEFMYAQASRDRYQNDEQPADLAKLVASLYRPKARPWQPAGDADRQRFDRRQFDAQALRMARLPRPLQLGILMNYEGCLDRFPAQFPHLFAGGDGGDSSWLDVGLSLARQTSALGTFAQLEQTDLFLVLTTLDAIMRENEQLRKQAENG